MRSATSRGFKHLPQPQGQVGILRCVGRGAIDRHLIEGKLVLAAAGQFAITQSGVPEPALCQRLKIVGAPPGIERVGDKLDVVLILHDDAMLREQHGTELDVEPDLQVAAGFKDRLQNLQRIADRDLIGRKTGGKQAGSVAGLFVAERDVACIVRRESQSEARQFGLHGIDRRRQGFEDKAAVVIDAGDPVLQPL